MIDNVTPSDVGFEIVESVEIGPDASITATVDGVVVESGESGYHVLSPAGSQQLRLGADLEAVTHVAYDGDQYYAAFRDRDEIRAYYANTASLWTAAVDAPEEVVATGSDLLVVRSTDGTVTGIDPEWEGVERFSYRPEGPATGESALAAANDLIVVTAGQVLVALSGEGEVRFRTELDDRITDLAIVEDVVCVTTGDATIGFTASGERAWEREGTPRRLHTAAGRTHLVWDRTLCVLDADGSLATLVEPFDDEVVPSKRGTELCLFNDREAILLGNRSDNPDLRMEASSGGASLTSVHVTNVSNVPIDRVTIETTDAEFEIGTTRVSKSLDLLPGEETDVSVPPIERTGPEPELHVRREDRELASLSLDESRDESEAPGRGKQHARVDEDSAAEDRAADEDNPDDPDDIAVSVDATVEDGTLTFHLETETGAPLPTPATVELPADDPLDGPTEVAVEFADGTRKTSTIDLDTDWKSVEQASADGESAGLTSVAGSDRKPDDESMVDAGSENGPKPEVVSELELESESEPEIDESSDRETDEESPSDGTVQIPGTQTTDSESDEKQLLATESRFDPDSNPDGAADSSVAQSSDGVADSEDESGDDSRIFDQEAEVNEEGRSTSADSFDASENDTNTGTGPENEDSGPGVGPERSNPELNDGKSESGSKNESETSQWLSIQPGRMAEQPDEKGTRGPGTLRETSTTGMKLSAVSDIEINHKFMYYDSEDGWEDISKQSYELRQGSILYEFIEITNESDARVENLQLSSRWDPEAEVPLDAILPGEKRTIHSFASFFDSEPWIPQRKLTVQFKSNESHIWPESSRRIVSRKIQGHSEFRPVILNKEGKSKLFVRLRGNEELGHVNLELGNERRIFTNGKRLDSNEDGTVVYGLDIGRTNLAELPGNGIVGRLTVDLDNHRDYTYKTVIPVVRGKDVDWNEVPSVAVYGCVLEEP